MNTLTTNLRGFVVYTSSWITSTLSTVAGVSMLGSQPVFLARTIPQFGQWSFCGEGILN